MPMAEAFEFRGDDPVRLVQVMEAISAERSGWVNLLAGVRPEDAPAPASALGAIFGAEVAAAPICTWVPGAASRRGLEPDRIGIQHASGPRAVMRLADQGLELPAGWRCAQDHSRRGLVVLVAADEAPEDVARWLIRAGTLLSTLPLSGEWRAEVYRRARRRWIRS